MYVFIIKLLIILYAVLNFVQFWKVLGHSLQLKHMLLLSHEQYRDDIRISANYFLPSINFSYNIIL